MKNLQKPGRTQVQECCPVEELREEATKGYQYRLGPKEAQNMDLLQLGAEALEELLHEALEQPCQVPPERLQTPHEELYQAPHEDRHQTPFEVLRQP
jgi:hypothetical protein